jgi:hypothetical protein
MDPGMTKAKGRQRREKGVKEISGAPEAKEPPEEPDEEGDEEGIRSDYPIYLSDEDRAVIRMVHGSRNQLLDFAIVQQVNVDGGWHDVVRYDCNHGTVHVHLFKRGGKQTAKRDICDLVDIDRGYDIAEAAILQGWKEQRRRYFHG